MTRSRTHEDGESMKQIKEKQVNSKKKDVGRVKQFQLAIPYVLDSSVFAPLTCMLDQK